MSSMQSLTDVQVVLLAAQLISDVDIAGIQTLAAERSDVLTRRIIFRLLLTLYPTDDAARSALIALLSGIENDFKDVSVLDYKLNATEILQLPNYVAQSRAKGLCLQEIVGSRLEDRDISIDAFIRAWTHRIEAEDGAVEELLPLVESFSVQNEHLRLWHETYLEPVIRLQYNYYPEKDNSVGVRELESLAGVAGIGRLLHFAAHNEERAIARDLDHLVAPWILGHDKCCRIGVTQISQPAITTSWADFNEWLLSTSLTDFRLASKAIIDWDGPQTSRGDQDVGRENMHFSHSAYAQAAFAVIYAINDSNDDKVRLAKQILYRTCSRLNIGVVDISVAEPDIRQTSNPDNSASEVDLFDSSLLQTDNALTVVTETSAAFTAGILHTIDVLRQFKILSSIVDVTRVCLSRSEDRQKQELRRLLQQVPRLTSTALDWRSIRAQILWLQSWRPISESAESQHSRAGSPRAYLSKVSTELLENEILSAILSGGQFVAAKAIYIESRSSPLPLTDVEEHIASAIFAAYDNASNGNRFRGGMRRAYDLLTAAQSSFPKSQQLQQVDHLIRATHSLSFYQLTLQHGIPFQPVNIRVHKDPLSLLGKVLEQDQKAYTKLDDLLEIGRNLVLSNLPASKSPSDEEKDMDSRVADAEHRITYLAITSALAAHDFDTAYSYITTRLSTTSRTESGNVDDTSWRAAYAAGRYRPRDAPTSVHTQISGLGKRMDLLSLALTLTPKPESLSEILGTWRRCEEEMNGLRGQALEEERAFEAGGEGAVPGGFGMDDRELDADETRQAMAKRNLAGSSATYEEEAPVGLFDVAKGAASALRRSAFPLRSTSGGSFKIQNTASSARAVSSPIISDTEGMGRTRKRDMVSGALVSGMSWMLGAQPNDRHDTDEE